MKCWHCNTDLICDIEHMEAEREYDVLYTFLHCPLDTCRAKVKVRLDLKTFSD